MSGAPGPDGRHDDLDADELEGLALLVPDDARSLDGDRASYLDELRGAASDRPELEVVHRRWHRLLGQRLRGVGLSGSVVIVVLAIVTVVGSSLTVFNPSTVSTPASLAPLATSPPAGVGEVGGLLPDTTLGIDGLDVPLRTARPALIVLVPDGCQTCGPTLASLLMQGREYNLALVLAGPPRQAGELTTFNTAELGGSGLVAIDKVDVLAASYAPVGVTAVLVRPDGVVGAVVRDIGPNQRLEPALAQLQRVGAPSATP